MDIVVHSGTDRHIVKLLKYIVDKTLKNELKWFIIGKEYDEAKEMEYKRYNTFIGYDALSELNITISVGKSSIPIDTIKDIKVKLFITYENANDDDISLIYSTSFYNTDKHMFETADSLLNILINLFDLMKFDRDKEKFIRDFIDKVIQ